MPLLKVQISEGTWPSRLYWNQLAEEYNVIYKNLSIKGDWAFKAELALLKGSNFINISWEDLEKVKTHVTENFLQVLDFSRVATYKFLNTQKI